MIIEISMNFFILCNSTDESDTEEFMEFPKNVVMYVWQIILLVFMSI